MPPLQTNRKRHFSERFVGAAYMRPAEFPPPQTSRAACMPPLRANPPTPAHPGSRWQPRGRGRACPARGVKGSCPLKGGRADPRAGRVRPLQCGPIPQILQKIQNFPRKMAQNPLTCLL